MRTKLMQAICVLSLIGLLSSCTLSKKTGCVPEKSRTTQVKFKGFL